MVNLQGSTSSRVTPGVALTLAEMAHKIGNYLFVDLLESILSISDTQSGTNTFKNGTNDW